MLWIDEPISTDTLSSNIVTSKYSSFYFYWTAENCTRKQRERDERQDQRIVDGTSTQRKIGERWSLQEKFRPGCQISSGKWMGDLVLCRYCLWGSL